VPSEAVYESGGQTYLLGLTAEEEEQLLFDRNPIEVVEEKNGKIAFQLKSKEKLEQRVLVGAYHFMGEGEGGEH
jgi:hypothetical protein